MLCGGGVISAPIPGLPRWGMYDPAIEIFSSPPKDLTRLIMKRSRARQRQVGNRETEARIQDAPRTLVHEPSMQYLAVV